MRNLWLTLVTLLTWALPALAQVSTSDDGPIPDRRLVVTRDVDFYGADLQALFDTTLAACRAVCLNDARCAAFTFNTRSNACFPKSTISDRQPYEGAISAQVLVTDPEVRSRAPARAADLAFLPGDALARARAEAVALATRHAGGEWSVARLLQAAQDRRTQGDLRNALVWTGAALAQTDAPEHWLDYAQLSAVYADSLRGADQRRYRERALLAAINGYLRADFDAERAEALLVLARALEQTGQGRATIPALRLAERLAPGPEVTALLDDAIGTYGFRILDHSVEADSAAPRLCAEFSEPLVRAGVDYAPFVRLPDPRLAVQASDRQLCIDGLSHGSRYAVTFRAGLPAADGEALVRDVTLNVYVRDRAPAVAFPGRAYVLPKTADAGIPIETVNLGAVDLTLRRVSDRNLLRTMQEDFFGRPLSQYQEQLFSAEIAEEIWTGQGTVENRLNADVLTRLPMGVVLGDLPAGVYALSAAVPGADPYDDPGATQWFILSDIGLTSMLGSDGLHVFARGLSDARALAGLEVTLLSRSNRPLAVVRTDADGVARFAAGMTRGTGGAAPALLLAKDGAEDFTFLSLTDPAFDLSDRGVEGREPAGPVDAFLATDRGAYRAGEVIHATALLRDAQARAIPGLPLTAVLTRPDGVEHARVLSREDRAGGHVFALPLAPSVPRGTWRLALFADPQAPALADRPLLVEDFVPERIDFDLSLPEGPINPDAPPLLEVSARYLFGAPGADLPIEGSMRMVARDSLDGFPGYRFGRHDAEADVQMTGLPGGLRTDAAGTAQVALPLPEVTTPGRPHEMTAVLRLSEGSGRPVEREISRPVAPSAPMIGIRPLFEGVVPEGTEAAFEVQAIGTDLAPAPMQVSWTLNRVTTRYQWYQLYGNWDWEPVTTRARVAGGTATLGDGPVRIAAPVDWGRYELVVERVDGAYVASSVDLYAGWYAPADTSATPDTLELSLDAAAYRPGDTATLRIVPRYAGTALVTVLAEGVIAMRAVEVSEGENVIPLEVTDDWGAGAYVTAQVIRPMDVAAGQNPARSLGLGHAAIDPGAKQLRVDLEAPETAQPRGPLNATLRVEGIAQGETAYATVAAVDLGILNLTGFQSPDPSAHYFGQRRLGVEIRDIYGRLIDGMTGTMGQIRSGGDAMAQMRRQSPPPTEDLVALFYGPVTVGPDGTATLRFDMPEFNGTVRLMAVAWSDSAVGQAEADVLVRDPVVVSAALPRFMAPGDASRLLLEIVHATGPAGRVGIEVSAAGLALDTSALPAALDLPAQGTLRLRLPVTAQEVGDHSLRVALTTPSGETLIKTLTLGVRANDPAISATRRLSLAPGQSFTLDAAVFDGLRPGTASALLSAGPLARLDVPGLLAALDRYPYGCTEQVTSQALPLLYLSDVAGAMGLGGRAQIDTRIDQAITSVLTRQAANGAFGLWRAESGDFWLDAYVTDFLSRARAEGHAVPDAAFRNAIDNLRNRISYAADFDQGGEDIAYALLVLAREGQAAIGDLRYYVDTKADAFATPLAQAQMGAALAQYGDQRRADLMLAKAAQRIAGLPQNDAPVWRADYGTPLRDAAGLLSLAVAADSDVVDRNALSARIAGAERRLSTQEQSWALMAAHALVDDPTVSGLSVDGAPVSGPFVRRISDDTLAPQVIANTGNTPTDVTLTTLGVPLTPAPAGGYGYAIERAYYRMDGTPLSGSVRTGDRLVTVLTVRPSDDSGARLMVDDPLPAGFEIDNPNLLRAGDIRALDWLETAEARHTEFRTDRFLAAVDWRSAQAFRLAYVVRAVSPGAFHHPAASVEDMYRPEFRARTDTARVVVAE